MLQGKKKTIIIAGYSGHAYVVIECLLQQGYTILGYLDKERKKNDPFGLSYLGYEEDLNLLATLPQSTCIVLGIGKNFIREKIYNALKIKKFLFPNVISKNTFLSKSAQLEEGNFINQGVIINALARIGKGVIINTGSVIEHECEVNDFTHVAPGTVLLGKVIIGKNSFIGANSVIKQGIRIGVNSIIGAGSVVLKNVPDNEIWAGNPAKKIK